MHKFDLSVIILNWNTRTLLEKCLNSVISNVQNSNFQIEVIIVDNGSTDGSKEFLKKLVNGQWSIVNSKKKNYSFEVILNDKNLGFAKGNNQGISQAQGEYLLLLNSDTEVKPGALATLVDHLKDNPDAIGVSPMLLNMDGSKQIDYYMRFPNFWQMIFYHNVVLRPIIMNISLKNLLIQTPKDEPFLVDQLPGAALMARKKTFNQVGLLDEDFSFLFEDVDWCYRAREKGNLVVVPQAEIKHVGGASWKKRLNKNRFGFYKQYFKSLLKFVGKHYPEKGLLLKSGLAISLMINTLAHLLTFSFNKANTQLKLFTWLCSSK